MRRRPRWPSDLERPRPKTFATAAVHRGASLVLAADRRAGVLFETALSLGDGAPELDAWSLQAALSARGIFATYDSCEAFLERLVAIAAGEAPPTTVETRVRALARAAGGDASPAAAPAAAEPSGDGARRSRRRRRRRRRPS